MKKYLMGVMAMGIISLLAGCGENSSDATKNASKNTIVIDYADYPEDFIVRLQAGQKYILKNGENLTDFYAKTNGLLKSRQIMKFGEYEKDLSNTVYYRMTEPVLVHCHDKDYIWICEETKDGYFINASVFSVSKYNSINSDSCFVNFRIKDEVLDPNDFVMKKSIKCFGSAEATVRYRVNELGKTEEIETNDEFYYIEPPYSEELLCLDSDIHVWVFDNEDSKESSIEDVPAGTTFRRLRVPKGTEYSFAEGKLDDGRVLRVVEEYWFSEPTPYQAMMDERGEQFEYHSLTDK